MIKRILAAMCCLCLCLSAMPVCAQNTPVLTGVLADDSVLTPGGSWFVEYDTTAAGEVTLTLMDESGDIVVASDTVEAGAHTLPWNGAMPDGSWAQSGFVRLMLTLTAGDETHMHMVPVEILPAEEGADALPAEDAIPETDDSETDDAEPAVVITEKKPVPTATSFWDMNPDDYDLSDPAHQQAIWDIMMQDITVFDKGEREHVYPTYEPGAQLRPRTNIAGELHGASQGVNVIEDDADGDGYVKIQAYSNDGTAIESSHVIAQAAQLIEGYVRKSLLKTVTPDDRYALLIDKLTQTLYIFERGAIIGELKVSTGFNTKEQPYNETPAGEYLAVSWVGQFVSGNMYCDMAIRINGGTLLHEVPHKLGTDNKTRYYENFERYLGQKASHGCIRIQRAKNEQGHNMRWLWDNLKKNTKVLIWEDKGRTMPAPELPADDTPLYRNLDGGKMYHAVAECPNVKKRFLPLTGDFTYGDLDTAPFDKLTPCPDCHAPLRKETILENWKKAAEQIGAAIPDDVLGSGDEAADEIEGADAPDE